MNRRLVKASATLAAVGLLGCGGVAVASARTDDDSAICAIVNVKYNNAQWIIGAGKKHGHATYHDNGIGSGLQWSRPVPQLVTNLVLGKYGTTKVRFKCKGA